MRFNRITKGREAQTQVFYDSDGEPYTADAWYYCNYQVDRCDRCGNEDSDYA